MRVRGRAAAGVLAAGMALTLVAAESAPATPQGTASTSMFGADITVTNFPALGELVAVDSIGARLMDLTTYATTVDTPFARTAVIPLTLPDESTPGAIEARSDGDTSGSSVLTEFGDPLGALGLSVNPISTSAYAGTTSAVASIQGAVAELAALGDLLGTKVNAPTITSVVGNSGAVATQGIQVSELELNLAALGLVSDVLAQLGIDQVLALLNGFGFDADLEEVNAVLDAIAGIQADIADELADLDDLVDSIDGLLGEYDALGGLLASLTGLSVADLLDASSLVAALTELDCDLEFSLLNVTLVTDATACVTGLINDVLDLLAGDLTDVLDIIGNLDDLLNEFGLELLDLDGLLASVLALLDGLDDITILGVSAFDIGVNAAATDSVDTSSATVLCKEIEVVVLGQTHTTPNCADGLSAVADAAGLVTGAVGELAGVLESALPIAGLGELKFDVFANLVREVTEVDGVVTATAGLDLLDMVIPSLSLDPDLVTNPLDLSILTGLLDDVLDALDDVLGTLGELDGVDAILSLVEDIEDAILGDSETEGLADLIEVLNGLIDGLLEELPFGTLAETIVTPGIALTIDPTSTASFQPGAPDDTPGAPDPDDGPELPSTGGGLALLGLLAISGAVATRRRRN